MMPRILLAFALLITTAVYTAKAVEPDEILSDPKLEARARDISAGLRCLVCQNQSIDDSDAGLARDLRLLVRQQLTAGSSDAEVIEFVKSRYGDFVLLKPPFEPATFFLWLAPVLLLAGGGLIVWRTAQSRRPETAETAPALTEQEARKLDDLLRDA
jgi:cytochrome c-type biogenesis protein CcmH